MAHIMDQTTTVSKPSDDLAYGQAVIVTARWILVLAAFLLALWDPDPIGQLRVQILVLLLLAVTNFYLHAQVLMRRPALDLVTYAASMADMVVITVMVAIGGGFPSGSYVFYFPAIAAYAVAFPTLVTFLYVSGTTSVYAIICLVTMGTGSAFAVNIQALIARVLMLAAIAFCGNLYWRIEHQRRQAAVEAQDALMAEIGQRGAVAAP